MQWVWQGRQSFLTTKWLTLSSKQTGMLKLLVFFFFFPMLRFSPMQCVSYAMECVSEAEENCCLPQSHDQLFYDERKQRTSLSSLCLVMEVTKQSWLQQILRSHERQGKESKSFTNITPLLKGCEGEDEELAYSNRMDWCRRQILLLWPIHSNLQI